MNILIFAASWDNRGDESAIRAMIDELKHKYNDVSFKIQFPAFDVEKVPYDDIEIVPKFINVPRKKVFKRLCYRISIKTGGKINLMPSVKGMSNKDSFNKYVKAVKWCDIAIYAPGGPNIGEIYKNYILLDYIDIINCYKKPYVFYAPSMGPFKSYKRRIKRVLNKAAVVCFREKISNGFVKKLIPKITTNVTLDSAFQHPIDTQKYEREFQDYSSLKEFVDKYDKVIGVTITDLQWHRKYSVVEYKDRIKDAFCSFIEYLKEKQYGVVFIPQLFGNANDKDYMTTFKRDNCFVVDDEHDCYFQQYLISRLYAVVGMRYHSNIFSAKMKTPFLSIAYEQKMKGFAEKVSLEEYCFSIEELSAENLTNHFEKLENDYLDYKSKLLRISDDCKKESYKTTQMVIDYIEQKGLNR